MTIDEKDARHIIADEGKVFRRKSDGFVYGNEIYLGKTWRIGDKVLEEPIEEQATDFEEIEESVE